MNKVMWLMLASCFTQPIWGSESTQLTKPTTEPVSMSWDDIVAGVTLDAQKWHEGFRQHPEKYSQFFAAIEGHEEAFAGLLNHNEVKRSFLLAAIHQDCYALVKAFVAKGTDLNDPSLIVPYVCLAAGGDDHLEILELLLTHEAAPGMCSEGTQNNTPLHLAAYKNDSEAVALLLKYGAPVEAESNAGITPLMNLFVSQHPFQNKLLTFRPGKGDKTPVARLLVEVGHASVHQRSRAGKIVLHYYASSNPIKEDTGVFGFLVAQGAFVDAQDTQGWTPLHDAAKNGNLFVATQLIHQGANLNIRDNSGCTPLDVALRFSVDAMVSLLVKSGAQTGIPTENAFMIATMANEPLSIDVLKAANATAPKSELDIALPVAAALGRSECLAALLKHGANKEHMQTPPTSLRPLHLAVTGRRRACVELLCKAGANKEFRQPGVSLPLHIAVGSRYGSVIAKTLLDQGANIEGKDMDGDIQVTPLHRAIKGENEAATRLLVSRGAAVNAKTSSGITPLMYVMEKFKDASINVPEMVGIMKLLLVHGARIDAVDNDGDTPLALSLGTSIPLVVRKELIRNCYYGYMPTRAELLASSRRVFEVIEMFSGRRIFAPAKAGVRSIFPPYVIAEILLSIPETRNDVIRMFLHQLRKGKLPQELLGDSAKMNLLQILFSSIKFRHGNTTYVTEYIQGKLLPHVNNVRGRMNTEYEDGKKCMEQLDALTQDLEADIHDAINTRYAELQEGAQKTLADLVPAPVVTPVPSPTEEPVAKRQRVEEPFPEEAEQSSALIEALPDHG